MISPYAPGPAGEAVDPIEAAFDAYLDTLASTPGTIIENCPKCLGVVIVIDDGVRCCNSCGYEPIRQ